MSHLTDPPVIYNPPRIVVWENPDEKDGYLHFSLAGDIKVLSSVHNLIFPHELSPYNDDGHLRLGFLCANGGLIHAGVVNFRLFLFEVRHAMNLFISPPAFDPQRFNLHFRRVENWLQHVYRHRHTIMSNPDASPQKQQGPASCVETGP